MHVILALARYFCVPTRILARILTQVIERIASHVRWATWRITRLVILYWFAWADVQFGRVRPLVQLPVRLVDLFEGLVVLAFRGALLILLPKMWLLCCLRRHESLLTAPIYALLNIDLVVIRLHLLVQIRLLIAYDLLQSLLDRARNTLNKIIDLSNFQVDFFDVLTNLVTLQNHLLQSDHDWI